MKDIVLDVVRVFIGVAPRPFPRSLRGLLRSS